MTYWQSENALRPGPAGLVIAAALLAQFALVSLTFPLSELFTATPLFYIDGAFHWYQMVVAKHLAAGASVVGYDPYFSAGYAGGITRNFSAKAPALLAALAPGASEIVLYKLYAFVFAVVAPAAVALGAWLAGASLLAVVVAAAAALFAWWCSYFHWYFTAGMVSFVTVAYLAVPYVVVTGNYLSGRGGIGTLVGLGIAGAALFLCHPAFPVLAALATLVFIAFGFGLAEPRRLVLLLSVVPLLSVLPNLLWLYPAYQYHGTSVWDTLPHQRVVDASLLWRELLGILSGDAHGSKVYAAVVLAALWACFGARDAGQRRLSRAFTCLAVMVEVLADVGAAIPGVGTMQPNRFAPVGYLMLCIPAGMGVAAMLAAARAGASPPWARRAGYASLVLMCGLGAVLALELVREVRPGPHGRYGAAPPAVQPLGPTSRWLLAWLRENTTREGRVLFETANARIHDGAHMAGYYAYEADRDFIGTNYPYMADTGFWDGHLFGKAIDALSAAELSGYLRLYNIGWIVVHSKASKGTLDRAAGVEAVAEREPLRLYRVRQPLTYFMQGRGSVERRGHNEVSFADVEGASVVLKFHYVPGLRSEPPLQLRPARELDDPIPFIAIDHPPARFRLFLP